MSEQFMLNRRKASAIVKAVRGAGSHTAGLDAFAKAIGFADQTAMMGALRALEALGNGSQDVQGKPAQRAEEFFEQLGDAREKIQKKPAQNAEEFFEALRRMAVRRIGEIRGTDLDRYDRSSWEYEVSNGDTKLGYEDWRKDQTEMAGDLFLINMQEVFAEISRLPGEDGKGLGRVARNIESALAEIQICAGEKSQDPEILNVEANPHLATLLRLSRQGERSTPQMVEAMQQTWNRLCASFNADGRTADPFGEVKAFVTLRIGDSLTEIRVDARHALQKWTSHDVARLLRDDLDDMTFSDMFLFAEDARCPMAIRARTLITEAKGRYTATGDTDQMLAWLEDRKGETVSLARAELSRSVEP